MRKKEEKWGEGEEIVKAKNKCRERRQEGSRFPVFSVKNSDQDNKERTPPT